MGRIGVCLPEILIDPDLFSPPDQARKPRRYNAFRQTFRQRFVDL